MNCINHTYDYLSYQDTTTTVMVNTMDCPVKKRVVCKPMESRKCASITYTTCTEKPVLDCEPVDVPCPSKEKIHKQWCLFNQGETAGPAKSADDDLENEVFEAQGKLGKAGGQNFNWILSQLE